MKSWRRIIYANTKQKRVEVTIVISDKMDFTLKKTARDKESGAGDSHLQA
jgi:hypothetical protein